MRTILLISLVFISNISAQQHDYTFSELRGMEDEIEKTHLFYRLYTFEEGGGLLGDYYENSIYHFDVGNIEDTLFLFEGGRIGDAVTRIVDLEFWNRNPAEFIYLGEEISVDPVAFIRRYDQSDPTFSELGEAVGLELGKQNTNIVIASAPYLIKSTDAGFNWSPYLDSSYLKMISISPYSDDEIFFTDGFDLLKTTDGGQTISVVDTNHTGHQLFYVSDSIHIYSLGNNNLMISDNRGNAFSWTNRYTSSNRIYISPDYSQSGKLYLADGKKIYVSENYGLTFYEFKVLEKDIVGIYKKPSAGGSNKLYAATKYKIYVITADTTLTIKSLPIPEEVLNLYPLAIGNKWVYDETTVTYDPYPQYYYRTIVREVLKDSLALNGKRYFHLKDRYPWEYNSLERVDSLEGKAYRYHEDQNLPENEYPIDDLLAEVGDTISSFRMGYGEGLFTTVLDEVIFEKWGLNKTKKVYEQYTLHPPVYSLTQDIGLDSIYSYFDFGETWFVIKGCVINGVVYGDTTVVSVEGETPNTPTKFSLFQNYPNPFNPVTKIRYEIPLLGRDKRGGLVILKVYDILGKEIITLVNEEKPTGEYEVEFNATELPSGIYFYQLKAGNYLETKKMILLK